MPTILSLVGIPTHGMRLQGRDLRGRLQDWAPSIDNRPVFAEAPLQGSSWHSIRTSDSKLMVTPPVNGTNWWNHLNQPSEALYILREDPFERDNVHGSRPEITAGLEGLLQQQLKVNNDRRQELGPVKLVPSENQQMKNLVELGYLEPVEKSDSVLRTTSPSDE